jgi:hypothetical protein
MKNKNKDVTLWAYLIVYRSAIAIAVLTSSCAKQKVMYKYEYSTPKSVEIGVTSSHLGDYERMTDAQLEVERVYQRKLVSINQHDVVLHDTMYVYNF